MKAHCTRHENYVPECGWCQTSDFQYRRATELRPMQQAYVDAADRRDLCSRWAPKLERERK